MKANANLLCSICYAFVLFLASCAPATEPGGAKFEFDHIVIFASNQHVEELLNQKVLTRGDKLETEHYHQGTRGQYFIFYNTFIEFLYLEDTVMALKNEKRFKSDYTKRWNANLDVCPFGFGLSLMPFDTSLTSFHLSPYHSLDSPKDEYYLMSDCNTDIGQPIIYVSAPERSYKKLDDLNQLDKMFDDPVRTDFRNYLTHPSGIKRLTDVIVTLPTNTTGCNSSLIQELNHLEIKWGTNYELKMIFDHGSQGKEISFNDNFKIIIQY